MFGLRSRPGLGGFVSLMFACAPNPQPCDVELSRQVPSPSGQHSAVVFTKDCGATTRSTIGVAVVEASRTGIPDTQFVAFVMEDSAGGEKPFSDSAIPEWDSDSVLVVRYTHRGRTFRTTARIGSVRVNYQLTQ